MKKLVILLTITCLGLGSSAQSYIGLKGGGGLSGLSNPSGTYVHLYGININAGFVYKLQISERIMLEGDLLFDIRSTVVDDPVVPDITATYISIPLTAHWMIPFRKKEFIPYHMGQPNSFWFVEGGPAIMYALSQTNYIDPLATAGLSAQEILDFEVSSSPIDVAFVAGAGLNFGFKNSLSRLIIGGRASYGFLNYNNYTNAPSFTNLAFGGYLEWDFSLSKKKYFQYRW